MLALIIIRMCTDECCLRYSCSTTVILVHGYVKSKQICRNVMVNITKCWNNWLNNVLRKSA